MTDLGLRNFEDRFIKRFDSGPRIAKQLMAEMCKDNKSEEIPEVL